MKGSIYVDNDEIGVVDFEVADWSMGVIQGIMTPTKLYISYVKRMQSSYVKKWIANMEDFNFRVVLVDKTVFEARRWNWDNGCSWVE